MAGKKSESTSNGQKTALVYCRVSTDKQKAEGGSLDEQAANCLEYAKANGYEVASVVREAYSGFYLYERDQLMRIIADIQAGKAQTLIVWNMNRLSRKMGHRAIILDKIERFGGQVIFVGENFDDSPEGKILASVREFMAEKEREEIRGRLMGGRRRRLLNGKLHRAGCNLFGYTRNPEGTARSINEDEARIVRQIFEWTAIEGIGSRVIAARLNDSGIAAPSTGKKDYRDGRVAKWGKSTIDRIIKEPAYKGVTIAWRWKSNGKHTAVSLRPAEENIMLPEGITPAIVSDELWAEAQRKKAANRGEMTRNESRRFLLRGRIVCAVCGRRMYAEHDGRLPLYRCSSRQHDAMPCGGKRTPAVFAEELVWQQVMDFLDNPAIIERELAHIAEGGPDTQLIVDLDSAKERLERTERDMKKLVRKLASTDDPTIERLFDEEIARLKSERQQTAAVISEIETRISSERQQLNNLQAVSDYCSRVRGVLTEFSFDEKRLALDALQAKVIANGREIVVEVSPDLVEVSQPERMTAGVSATTR